MLLHAALDFATHPDAVAIVEARATTTYRELGAVARRVAARLLGVMTPSDRFVGITAAVTAESIAAIIGVLQAGKAYVPLDVHSPPARLAAIIRDAELRVLFLDPVAYPEWRELARLANVVIVLGGDDGGPDTVSWPAILAQPEPPPPRPAHPILSDDLAYILYTSGSTGEPKGVMLTHRNARTFVDWMAKEFQIVAADRVAARAPLNFDLSVFDVFNTLAAGATLLVHDQRKLAQLGMSSERRHAEYVAMLRANRASVLYTTPSTFVALLERGGLDASVPLRVIMYAGEPFPPALLRRLMLALPRTRVANIYGPTETNIVTCHWVAEPPADETPIPIGREVDDTEILVVGDDGRLCAAGEPGELWVRGGTVCVGYFGKPELTRERLVDSSFHRYPAKLWRTGDQGRRLADGTLLYHGRIDSMVKLRGYRVELGDVEAALAAHPGVAQSVVLPQLHPAHGTELHALVVLREAARVAPAELLAFLAARLPSYMLPRAIELATELPTTSTGKVDRQALLATLRSRA